MRCRTTHRRKHGKYAILSLAGSQNLCQTITLKGYIVIEWRMCIQLCCICKVFISQELLTLVHCTYDVPASNTEVWRIFCWVPLDLHRTLDLPLPGARHNQATWNEHNFLTWKMQFRICIGFDSPTELVRGSFEVGTHHSTLESGVVSF